MVQVREGEDRENERENIKHELTRLSSSECNTAKDSDLGNITMTFPNTKKTL